VIPVICLRPSFARALRAFFSPRDWMLTLAPAGMETSPWSWPAWESSESESASSTVGWLVGASSSSSSILDIYAGNFSSVLVRPISSIHPSPSGIELTHEKVSFDSGWIGEID